MTMTPAEQIAYLRDWMADERPLMMLEAGNAIHAVCDLAERALLTDDEAEAVRRWTGVDTASGDDLRLCKAVLRRLLPDERVEHRLWAQFARYGEVIAECSCTHKVSGPDLDAAVRAWAAHAGIGGTE